VPAASRQLPFGKVQCPPSLEGPMIHVVGLVKSYGTLRAVDGVSFDVAKGELYGLLGPNGAGKTTTMSMLSGLLAPDEGRILCDGVDLATHPLKVKAQLGVVPQEPALYENLSARENLTFWGGLYGLTGADLQRAVDRALDLVGLRERAKDPVKQYSGGMKRRVNLALGLVHGPRAVLMDEPTVGIDPQARLNILDAVRQVAAAGTTVIYTTHYLDEVESLCDRIAIMDHGKILAEGTLDQLKSRVGGRDVVTVRGTFDTAAVLPRLDAIEGVSVTSAEPGKLVLTVDGSGRGAVDLLGRVLAEGLPIEGISIQPPSLNTLFLNLTGRELRD
jgi:ABC-2 type transport system ATP-binding protein